MIVRTSHRIAAVVAPVAVAALLFGACGGSDSTTEGAGSIVPLNSGQTDYETIAPETTEPPVVENSATGTEPPNDNDTGGEGSGSGSSGGATSDYVVKSGDIPVQVAERFNVSFQDLQDANPDTDFTKNFPTGATIKIPGGGSNSDSSDSGSDSSDAGSNDGGEDTGGSDSGSDAESADTIPESGDNCSKGSYVIKQGDFPNQVAKNFDVSLDALQEANSDLDFSSQFPIGKELVIPTKDNC